MKKMFSILLAFAVLILSGHVYAESVSGMRELFQISEATATPAPNAFRFRDGISWGMNTQQL